MATLAQRISDLATAIGTRIKAEARVATGPLGYATGAGGTATQATNKTTAVTLNKLTGQITLAAGSLASGASATFVLNNNLLVASDQLIVTHHAVGTFGAYGLAGRVTGAGVASITVRNNTAGALNEAIVLKVTAIRAPTA